MLVESLILYLEKIKRLTFLVFSSLVLVTWHSSIEYPICYSTGSQSSTTILKSYTSANLKIIMNNLILSNERPTKRARRSDNDSQCDACTRLFSQLSLPKLNSEAGLAHQTRVACEASIRNGCDLCSLVLKLAVDEFGSRWGRHEPIVFRNFSPVRGPRAPIYTLQGTIENGDGCITLYPFAKHGIAIFPHLTVSLCWSVFTRRPARYISIAKADFEGRTKLTSYQRSQETSVRMSKSRQTHWRTRRMPLLKRHRPSDQSLTSRHQWRGCLSHSTPYQW